MDDTRLWQPAAVQSRTDVASPTASWPLFRAADCSSLTIDMVATQRVEIDCETRSSERAQQVHHCFRYELRPASDSSIWLAVIPCVTHFTDLTASQHHHSGQTQLSRVEPDPLLIGNVNIASVHILVGNRILPYSTPLISGTNAASVQRSPDGRRQSRVLPWRRVSNHHVQLNVVLLPPKPLQHHAFTT